VNYYGDDHRRFQPMLPMPVLPTMEGVDVVACDARGVEDNAVVDDVHIPEVVLLRLHSHIYHRGPLVEDNIQVVADTHIHPNDDDAEVVRNMDDSSGVVAYNIPDDIRVVVVHTEVVDSDHIPVDPHYYYYCYRLHCVDIHRVYLDRHHVVVVVDVVEDNNTNDVPRAAWDILVEGVPPSVDHRHRVDHPPVEWPNS
jgi:hypothetical protein